MEWSCAKSSYVFEFYFWPEYVRRGCSDCCCIFNSLTYVYTKPRILFVSLAARFLEHSNDGNDVRSTSILVLSRPRTSFNCLSSSVFVFVAPTTRQPLLYRVLLRQKSAHAFFVLVFSTIIVFLSFSSCTGTIRRYTWYVLA